MCGFHSRAKLSHIVVYQAKVFRPNDRIPPHNSPKFARIFARQSVVYNSILFYNQVEC